MNILYKILRNQAIMNMANPECPDKCQNAQKTLLNIANTQTDIDILDLVIVCWKCKQSYWKIMEKK
jgi:hypothetical protein